MAHPHCQRLFHFGVLRRECEFLLNSINEVVHLVCNQELFDLAVESLCSIGLNTSGLCDDKECLKLTDSCHQEW